ncbi:LysR family transcriptional regulator [Thauera linaloolentis]|uniref:Transcriptional regulator n=1 Tax=Thauera linaloolentis (strain DSM 12138 / JCM 21573 / CCUG 41526 / CIP 105981 / IAM 15112 / NBRC 102519 / 47Lol) TaxID=1123367 RepID=N6YY56_THAL4|nr:LysR family transcriptional regulator [Thauera linaloolentis]ENO84849.1 transcriptional regulator [Thauera linaloolentis 47Lol = DSM 12138]MCM8564852.1 LysR family transcriptional regulator [Thauera linaloolentis]
MQNRLEMLRIFCSAAETRNFKEAATRLGVSPQAVTRAVKELESHVGELLFHRNTRHTRITEFGEQLAARARLGVQGVDEIFRKSVKEQDDSLSGLVRITAPRALQRDWLTPVLGELCARHPGLQLDLRLSDQFVDVVDEQIDIGVRLGFMRDSRFVARAVAQVPFHVVGAPELITRVGVPHTLQELAERPTTVVIDPNTGKPWVWFLARGQQWLPRTPAFATDDTRAEADAVVAGIGFGQLAAPLARPHLRAGRLVEVLPELRPEPWGLSVYRPQRGPVAARIRLVFDRLVEHFSGEAASLLRA